MLNADSHWKLKLPSISRSCFVVNHNKEKTFKTDTDEVKFNTENHREHNWSKFDGVRTIKNFLGLKLKCFAVLFAIKLVTYTGYT